MPELKDNVSYRPQNKCMCVFWIIQTLFAESCLYDKLFTSVILSRSDECSKLQDVKAIPTCFSKTYQQGCSYFHIKPAEHGSLPLNGETAIY